LYVSRQNSGTSTQVGERHQAGKVSCYCIIMYYITHVILHATNNILRSHKAEQS